MKIGFIGVGWMGFGIANNILKNNHELFVIANKNRKPIDRIVEEGAKEVKSYDELCKSGLDALFLCVTNSPIAHEIGKKIVSLLTDKTIVIDITTHNQNGSIEMEQILKANNIPYVITNDNHYVNQEDHSAHELLMCLQTNSNINDPHRFKFDDDNRDVVEEDSSKP